MRFIYSYYYLLCLFLFACGKEYSHEGGPLTNQPSGDSVVHKSAWEFKESSILYKGPVDTAFLIWETGKQLLSISGKSTSGDQRISIVISNAGSITAGTYATNQFQVKFFYTTAADTLYAARPYFGGNLSVTITEIDDHHVKGTFRGIALDKTIKSRDIVDGSFSSTLKKASAATATGAVLLWASENCNGPIKVKVNNIAGEITSFPFMTPDCGEAGSAGYSLKPGNYKWVAYCDKDSISGNVKVSADSCSKIKIEFPFTPAAVTYTKDSCKIKSINATGVNHLLVNTEFLNNKINAIIFPVDVYAGMIFSIPHRLEVDGDTIMFADRKHKFVLDPSGKVIRYSGLLRADVWQSQKVTNNFTYGNGANLTQVNVIKDDGTPFRNLYIAWQNGNLTSIKIEYLASGSSNELLFDYYLNKEVAAFPFVFMDIPEMFFFQTGLNFGHSSKNAVKSMRQKSYDNTGKLVSDLTWAYERYIIDANNYVQQVRVHRIDRWDDITDYMFTYHCF
jgi:hypothetical protein